MRRLALTLVCVLLTACGGTARSQGCTAIVNGTPVEIADGVVDAPSPGLLERLSTGAREFATDPLGREANACDSEKVIAFMAAVDGMSAEEAAGYCLAPDRSGRGFYLVPGARDYRGRCDRTTCERVNMAAADAVAIAGVLEDLSEGTPVEGLTTNDSVASNALLVSGQSGILRRVLNEAAGHLGALIFSSPQAIGATAVTVLAAGGALYLCSG
ncbi:hypothetical protein [Wenxinia marina]|uniref:Lipoprotein n=1 Tax=Wenxinia marina DSM 24838 TaxID=1123501 RepID=A0A0D0Q5V2_9RHOB|nr:hypothetical protein [Wenxinia marina]KIQ69859.1 hypothetical protein Wenmar_01429 [Wenxinia marina DSM 24838]GGL61754.1 hypothetical protein GCM10011392_15320 [Wenxinia marina]